MVPRSGRCTIQAGCLSSNYDDMCVTLDLLNWGAIMSRGIKTVLYTKACCAIRVGWGHLAGAEGRSLGVPHGRGLPRCGHESSG